MTTPRTWPAFSLTVLLGLGLFVFFGAVLLLPERFVAMLGSGAAAHATMHFRLPQHRVHDLTFAFLLGTAGLGLLSQLRAPTRRSAGQLMALVPFAGLLLALALGN